MGWRLLVFYPERYNSTNTVVYFYWKMVIYIYVCGQCRTQFMLRNSSRLLLINMNFYDAKVSRIDGAFVTIILCLHVLIARRMLLILDMLIIVSEYRCLKR
jgi:hypothetical protein